MWQELSYFFSGQVSSMPARSDPTTQQQYLQGQAKKPQIAGVLDFGETCQNGPQ
jgi:hypothetical protein